MTAEAADGLPAVEMAWTVEATSAEWDPSTVGSLSATAAIVHAPGLPRLPTFALVGFVVTVAYNLLLLAEQLFARALKRV